MSSGSNERTSGKKVQKDPGDQKEVQKTLYKNIDNNHRPEFCQRIKMKNDHSRNLYHHQNNHHRYKIYSSGERELEEAPGNYLAKTSEKLKMNKKKEKDTPNTDKAKISNLNQNNFKKIIFKNSNKSRGRSNKSGPLSNRNSSGEVANSGVRKTQPNVTNSKKNPHQTIKFNKKKIHIVRSTSQNPKRSRSLSNNVKVSSSKRSDESGNANEGAEENTSNSNKKAGKVDMHTNWQNTGSNIEKIAALASISKYNNTTNFNSEEFQASHMMRKGNPQTHTNIYLDVKQKGLRTKKDFAHPVSPTSTKSLIENEAASTEPQAKPVPSNATLTSKPNVLSMTIKAKDNILSKNSGTIEASSYNSLLSHQSKSFSNTKNEKSVNSIINTKTIVSKKR